MPLTSPSAGDLLEPPAEQSAIPKEVPPPEDGIQAAQDSERDEGPLPEQESSEPAVNAQPSEGAQKPYEPVSTDKVRTLENENDSEEGTDPNVRQNVGQNSGTVIGVQNISEIHRLRGTPLPKEWIDAQLHTYLPDDGTTKAIGELLTNHRIAVLHAEAGTGRYTTALHALTSQGVGAIRQVRREPNEQADLEGLKDEDTGWILDLRDEEETLRPGFGLHLREVSGHLRETRSFVAVVTHSETWKDVAHEAPRLAHPLVPPPALDVLRAHLTRPPLTVDEPEEWLRRGKIIERLAGGTPGHAVRWARIISAATALNRTSAEEVSFDDLVESVIQSAQNWRRELRIWHTKNTVSAHRNYLLAAATLDGAPAEVIYEAHTTLGTALEDTSQPTNGQQGPGIIELTHESGAELSADDRIRFLKPGYAEAVVDYFWVDRPHHVAAFTRWTAEQAASLPRDLAIPLANRVTQWAIRYTITKPSFTILRAVATHWANTQHLRDHAKDLLVAAAVDPTTGRRAREQYLAWAKAPDTEELTHRKHSPTVLKQALANALAQLGPAYPQIALKRLSELAVNTSDPAVADAVGDALTALWDQPRLQDTIRTTLTSWFSASQHHYRAAARRAFLQLAERTTTAGTPVLLARTNTELKTWTITGWRCVLDDPNPYIQEVFNTWMEAALTDAELRPAIRNIFTEALMRSEADRIYLAPRFIVLNHAANGWEPAHAGQQPTDRTRLRDELLTELRAADPTAPDHQRHAPPRP